MTIFEETDEYLFVQHVTDILKVENSLPHLAPGGMWEASHIRLTWGVRLADEPPSLSIVRFADAAANNPLSRGVMLPRDMPGRLALWRQCWSTWRKTKPPLLADFRFVTTLTAILAWNPEGETMKTEMLKS